MLNHFVLGTANGITAMQMDLKVPGISLQILKEALLKGQRGIEHMLTLMGEVQSSPRVEFKSSVPVVETMSLPSFRQHILFRSGGFNAKLIDAETGVKVFF